MRRTWIKIFCDQMLRGTTCKELEPDERWVWVGFLLLAGDSPCEGAICISPGVGFSNEQLAKVLRVPLKTLVSAKAKCQKFGKVETDQDGVIWVVNWGRYQSEYARQKRYREQWRAEGEAATTASPQTPLPREEETEEEGEGEQRVTPSYKQKLQTKVTKKGPPPRSFRVQERLLDLLDAKTKVKRQIKIAETNPGRCYNEDGKAVPLATLEQRLAAVEAEEQAVQNIPAGAET